MVYVYEVVYKSRRKAVSFLKAPSDFFDGLAQIGFLSLITWSCQLHKILAGDLAGYQGYG